jgi:hypothetical protein
MLGTGYTLYSFLRSRAGVVESSSSGSRKHAATLSSIMRQAAEAGNLY